MSDPDTFVGDNDHGNTEPHRTVWIVVLSDGETYSEVRGTTLLQITEADADALAAGGFVADTRPVQRISLERAVRESVPDTRFMQDLG
jgi:hypothetical protein